MQSEHVSVEQKTERSS